MRIKIIYSFYQLYKKKTHTLIRGKMIRVIEKRDVMVTKKKKCSMMRTLHQKPNY